MLTEIEIYRNHYATSVDMQKVYNALRDANLDFDPQERRGNIYGGTPAEDVEYVFVSCVTDAVRVINALGYTTDEDEDGAEE